MQPDAVNRRDADGSGNDVFDFLKLAVQRVVGLDDLLAEIVKHLAFPREAEFLFAAFNEKRFELAFQRTDLLADGGLRYFVDLGGFRKTFGFGEVTENFQTFNLHKQSEYEKFLCKSTYANEAVGRHIKEAEAKGMRSFDCVSDRLSEMRRDPERQMRRRDLPIQFKFYASGNLVRFAVR